MIKLKLSCSLFLLLFSLSIIAQNDYRPGYIIKTNTDTVYGEINYQNDLTLGRKCEFKDDVDLVTIFSPDQILAYRFISGRYFVSKQYKQDNVFFEYLVKGIVSLYFLKDEVGEHFFIEKDTIPLTELSYDESIKVIDGNQYLFKSKGYVNQLDYFMHDAGGILPKIESISKPQHRELINLVEFYHNKVCIDEKCMIYDKKAPFLRISIEPAFGIGKYRHYKKAFYSFGGFINVQSSYEKFYFRTGIFHYEGDVPYHDISGELVSLNQIPFQIQYIMGGGQVKTKMGLGFNLNILSTTGFMGQIEKPAYFSPNFNFGILSQITNSIDLSIGFNLQTYPFFNQFHSNLEIGLKFNLN